MVLIRPKKNQKFGSEATIATFKMVNDLIVEVRPTTKDKYGRTIAWVYIGNQCVNEELIKEGFAWHYKKYSSDQELSDLEEIARKNKVGLWTDSNPIAPWDFRHGTTASTRKDPNLTSSGDISYHGNIQSKIFHKPNCKYYNCKNCVSIFPSREEAIVSGYRPCKICNP